jgi:hypothetical protein
MIHIFQPLIMTFCIGLFLVFVYAYHLHDKDIPPCETIYKLETPQIEYANVFGDTTITDQVEQPSYHDLDYRDSEKDTLFDNIFT